MERQHLAKSTIMSVLSEVKDSGIADVDTCAKEETSRISSTVAYSDSANRFKRRIKLTSITTLKRSRTC